MKPEDMKTRLRKELSLQRIPRSRKITLIVVACLGLLIWAKPLGLLLWARIRILTNIPKTAIADPALAEAAKPALPVDIDPQLPDLFAQLRDPFRVDSTVFPLPLPKQPDPGIAQRNPTTTVPSGPAVVTEEERQRQEFDAARVAAESLRVQSAGAGLVAAIVENKAVRVGETVQTSTGVEFELVKVLDAGVVVRRNGREYTVLMPVKTKPLLRPGTRSEGRTP